jgi:predicted anti-sigma-YlaC factor YlaD
MNCERFLGQLEDLADRELPPAECEAHAAVCAECRRKLVRARSLASLLRSLPAPSPPPALRARVLAAARRRPAYSMMMVRVAAAIFVLIGVSYGIAFRIAGGSSYEPLDLTVLPMAENGPADEEFALEVMYGPGIPIGDPGPEGIGSEGLGSSNDR